jgi:hypothetical protein
MLYMGHHTFAPKKVLLASGALNSIGLCYEYPLPQSQWRILDASTKSLPLCLPLQWENDQAANLANISGYFGATDEHFYGPEVVFKVRAEKLSSSIGLLW